jgi:hypothetical protein
LSAYARDDSPSSSGPVDQSAKSVKSRLGLGLSCLTLLPGLRGAGRLSCGLRDTELVGTVVQLDVQVAIARILPVLGAVACGCF